jgi:hypothetical protein
MGGFLRAAGRGLCNGLTTLHLTNFPKVLNILLPVLTAAEAGDQRKL